MKKKIHLIAAARPNFMKIAPLYHALCSKDWADAKIVHTGQHYDINMSDAFFQDLQLPKPHIHLGVGSGTHAEQTGKVMIAYEKVLMDECPDLVVVVGDVNSTAAATLAAVKLGVKVAHLEAGLRSFDRTMPEEINRIVTDSLADLLWTPSPDADGNLLHEGVPPEKIQRVGNIMIDSLEMLRGKIEQQETYRQFGLNMGEYGIVTLHRPSNVDDSGKLATIIEALNNISRKIPLVFPVHPRTRKNLNQLQLTGGPSVAPTKSGGYRTELPSPIPHALCPLPSLILTEPLSYLPFMNLVFGARLVITDSGGLQEETTYLGIPCLTLRPNTERPITLDQGSNKLCTVANFEERAQLILVNGFRRRRPPELWDGQTSARVIESILCFLEGNTEV